MLNLLDKPKQINLLTRKCHRLNKFVIKEIRQDKKINDNVKLFNDLKLNPKNIDLNTRLIKLKIKKGQGLCLVVNQVITSKSFKVTKLKAMLYLEVNHQQKYIEITNFSGKFSAGIIFIISKALKDINNKLNNEIIIYTTKKDVIKKAMRKYVESSYFIKDL